MTRTRCAKQSLKQRGLCRLFPGIKLMIDRAAHDAGISFFRVADLARFMDLLASEAGIRGGKTVIVWNAFRPAALPRIFRLRCIVFIREAALGERFDLKRIGLRAMSFTSARCVSGRTQPSDSAVSRAGPGSLVSS